MLLSYKDNAIVILRHCNCYCSMPMISVTCMDGHIKQVVELMLRRSHQHKSKTQEKLRYKMLTLYILTDKSDFVPFISYLYAISLLEDVKRTSNSQQCRDVHLYNRQLLYDASFLMYLFI